METASIFGSILFASFVFYFVIKAAVKKGINESMLFTDEQREAKEQAEQDKVKGCFERNKEKS